MATFTITIVAVNDVGFTFNPPAEIRLREGQTHQEHIGRYCTQGTPLVTQFAIAEDTDTDNIISNLGLSATQSGTYTASVTLTPAQAANTALNDTDPNVGTLWLQFDLAAVTVDTQATLTFTTTDP